MNVVVVIPMHGHADLTDQCVRTTLENAGMPCRILVVDDCSPEPYKAPEGLEDKVAVLRLKKHSGFTKAINAGLRFLRLNFDFVCLLNNDTVPEKLFLLNMVYRAKSDSEVGIVGASRIVGHAPYKVAMWGTDLLTGMVACDYQDPIEAQAAIWIPFCCVLLSRDCVQAVGLLDERLVNHCSDNDYCLRAIFMDFGIIHEPTAKVFHHQSKTIHELGIEPYEDQKYFAKKWFGPAMNEILSKIPVNEGAGKWGEIGFRYTKKDRDLSLVTE